MTQWVRWTMPEFVREGRIVKEVGPSVVVHFLGFDQPQVFPMGIKDYLNASSSSPHRMEYIPRPSKATEIEQAPEGDMMPLSKAAAILGTTPKRVRALLREGKLTGRQEDGRWRGVDRHAVLSLAKRV